MSRPFYNSSSFTGRFPGDRENQAGKPRTGNFRKSQQSNTVGGAIPTEKEIQLKAALALKAQAYLPKPTSIWKRMRNGKYQFVKSYHDYQTAKESLPKIPGFPGEVAVIVMDGKPDDSLIEALKDDSTLVKFF